MAQDWARWMAQNQVLKHNPDRREQAGTQWWMTSEVIVRHTYPWNMTTEEILAALDEWWRGPPVHNENMLRASFTHVGTGYHMGPGGQYAVHIYGAKWCRSKLGMTPRRGSVWLMIRPSLSRRFQHRLEVAQVGDRGKPDIAVDARGSLGKTPVG